VCTYTFISSAIGYGPRINSHDWHIGGALRQQDRPRIKLEAPSPTQRYQPPQSDSLRPLRSRGPGECKNVKAAVGTLMLSMFYCHHQLLLSLFCCHHHFAGGSEGLSSVGRPGDGPLKDLELTPSIAVWILPKELSIFSSVDLSSLRGSRRSATPQPLSRFNPALHLDLTEIPTSA
jgi:hypothetical protein